MTERKHRAISLSASFFLPSLLLAGTAAASGPADPSSEIDTILRATVAEDRLPSLSVAVASDGEIVYSRAHGFADVENSVAATPDTVYPIGSVSKTVTAVAALKLAERGKLDPDRTIQHYCPAFPEKPHEITVRQLLAHLGGIRHYDYSRFEEDFLNRRRYASIEEALSKFAEDPLVAEPGTEYHYSSWGYVLVGCALEGAGGEDFSELIQTNVLGPAEMRQTRLDVASTIVPHRARGYSKADDGSWRNSGCFDASDRYPAGGMIGTPGDLVRLGSALMEGRLLEEPSLRTMWTPQETASGEATGAGLGWDLSEDGEEVFQGGTTVGATTFLYLRPKDGVAVAFVTNLSLWTGQRLELARTLAELARRLQGSR